VTWRDDGELVVRIARGAVYRALNVRSPVPLPEARAPGLAERRGVFVTWYRRRGHRLRGCIGFPEPVLPLADGLAEAAVAAALEDPRFPPIGPEELPELVVEVSVLTPSVPLPVSERPRGVRVGVDGLVVEHGRSRGLLLPQVAPDQRWDAEQFLNGACEKAGLPREAWRSADVTVARFQAQVFRETAPWGPVEAAGSAD
jgi:uncharacterized protein